MSNLRPGTASRLKTAQMQGTIGTATRLTTAMRPGTRGGAPGATLNTLVCVEDRPITQQGLGGLKNTFRGPKRQIEDKSYFLGILRGKINELNLEIGTLSRQAMDAEEENASFVQYEQMAEKLATEIKELQGELGDYNTLVDKANLGDDLSSVEIDWEEVRTANERAERNLENLFEERQKREINLKSAELELKQEQQISETLIQEMNDEERERYYKAKDLNIHLLNQLNDGQIEIEKLINKKIELEEELANSQVKQEAMRIYAQLHEAEVKRDQLLSEEASKEDPQQERQRLLLQVREDNQEIASIERQTREIQDKIANNEEELRLLENELDESRSERTQKYRELKKREHQIDEFLKTFDGVKSLELSGIGELESTIVELLDNTSRHIINANQTTSETGVGVLKSTMKNSNIISPTSINMSSSSSSNNTNSTTTNTQNPVNYLKQQLDFKTAEVSKSEETANNLNQERIRLGQDLLKVDHLETKITQEMEILRKRITKMEEEILTYSDLDKVREDAKFKRQTLTSEKSRLDMYRQNLNRLNQDLAKEYNILQTNLNGQDTHNQLTNLEHRWAQHEQINYSLNEFIANKRLETDHTKLADHAMELVRNYNETLKSVLGSKPVIV